MKINAIRSDLVAAQRDAIWNSLVTGNGYQKYRLLFEIDPLLSSYGDILTEEQFLQIENWYNKNKFSKMEQNLQLLKLRHELFCMINVLPFV